ncbi:MAG: hypothetical protein ACYC5O_19620 [Anaerolineae bacterium]
MTVDLAQYLDRLEAIVEPERAEANARLQEAAWGYGRVERVPVIVNYRDKVSKERKGRPDWPSFPYSEVFHSPEKMLLDELEDVYVGALVGDDKVYTVRANLGVGVLPSLFGCEVRLEPGNDLPWVEPIADRDVLRCTIAAGVPVLDAGLLAQATEYEHYFRETLAAYPRLSRAVHVAQTDLQGPMNVTAEIMGTDIYTTIYDEPGLVHDLLDVVTETYIAATKAQKQVLGEEPNRAYHWHMRVVGGIRISEDFALSMSPGHYNEFAAPYNARCYAAFGGGYLLYADEGMPVLEEILNTPGITGIFRWTEKAADFDRLWPLASARRICVVWNGPLPADWRQRAPTGLIIERVVADAAAAAAALAG